MWYKNFFKSNQLIKNFIFEFFFNNWIEIPYLKLRKNILQLIYRCMRSKLVWHKNFAFFFLFSAWKVKFWIVVLGIQNIICEMSMIIWGTHLLLLIHMFVYSRIQEYRQVRTIHTTNHQVKLPNSVTTNITEESKEDESWPWQLDRSCGAAVAGSYLRVSYQVYCSRSCQQSKQWDQHQYRLVSVMVFLSSYCYHLPCVSPNRPTFLLLPSLIFLFF